MKHPLVFANMDSVNEQLEEYPGYVDLMDVLDVFKVRDETHLLQIYRTTWEKGLFTNP